jgi:hypothetical protein
MNDPKRKMQGLLLQLCILHFALFAASCSIPNLESRQCAESRDMVKEFYSWYLGTEAEQRNKQADVFSRYVSQDSSLSLAASPVDPFFRSQIPPTTFKIGKCEVMDDRHTTVQVQLYWRDPNRTEQREVFAHTSKTESAWLIERVDGE